MKIAKGIKLMVRKGSRAALHYKGFEPNYGPRQGAQTSLGYHTNTKGKPNVQFPTKVAPKEENHQMLDTKKLALCHQDKSCLCRGRNVRRWLCATKANYNCATDRM